MSKMTDPEPPADLACRVVAASVYLTLATADDSGRPWATPVWYADRDCDEFVWVSRPDARHSQNIAARPEVGIVIFDSTVPVGGAAAVYVEAEAEEVGPDDREDALAVFNERSEAQDLRLWRESDVVAPAPHRLYRATATQVYVLDDRDRRIPVT
jgi:pyridoxine/pyridoxamine 5'-phosphate oxidase